MKLVSFMHLKLNQAQSLNPSMKKIKIKFLKFKHQKEKEDKLKIWLGPMALFLCLKLNVNLE